MFDSCRATNRALAVMSGGEIAACEFTAIGAILGLTLLRGMSRVVVLAGHRFALARPPTSTYLPRITSRG
jgi:hypothetical protein